MRKIGHQLRSSVSCPIKAAALPLVVYEISTCEMRRFSSTGCSVGGLATLFGYAFGFCGCKMLQGIFDFQCMMDGATARYWKALLAPVLPLILLTLCGFMEFAKRGSGCSTAAQSR